MKVKTVEDMLGVEPSDGDVSIPTVECPQPMVNVRKRLRDLPDNPCRPRDGDPNAGRPDNTLHGFIQDQLLHVIAQAQVNVDDEISLEGAELLLDQVGDVEWEDEDMNEDDNAEDDEVFDDVLFDDDFDEAIEEEDVSEVNDDSSSTDEEDSHAEAVTEESPEQSNQNNTNEAAPSQSFAATSELLAEPFQHAFGQLHEAVGQLEQAIDSLENSNVLPGEWPIGSSDIPGINRLPPLHSRRLSRGSVLGEPAVRTEMVFFPHNCTSHVLPEETWRLVRFLKRGAGSSKRVVGPEHMGEQSSQRYHLLRTYEKDLELRSLGTEKDKNRREIGVLCPDAVRFGGFVEPGLRHYFHATGRLSMLIHIPELYLVAIGSPTGRVVLLTPTKLASRTQHSIGVWAYGFRVEHILPRESDEKEFRKTLRPLHGLAVGPLQQGEKLSVHSSANRLMLPKRYRLMLHYRTHDILTYEIERDGQTGKLCIF
jgi:hypothetical protein